MATIHDFDLICQHFTGKQMGSSGLKLDKDKHGNLFLSQPVKLNAQNVVPVVPTSPKIRTYAAASFDKTLSQFLN
jgi:hypothetical protein